MLEVVGVSFKEKGRIYYFSPNGLELKKDYYVIVETERGLQFGKVETNITKLCEKKIFSPLKKVMRIATKKDYEINNKNIEDATKALEKCKNLVKNKILNMQVIDAAYTFDRDQLIFHFLSDNRVDFRDLVKSLATIYKTRIELRQVGVRDKAREIGGLGPCGRPFCCSKFLNNFDTVSINMAKNQNMSLNPTKINGVCGRLLCCLNYEDETYRVYRKNLPEIGQTVICNKKNGKVVSIDVLKQKYKVDVPHIGIVEMGTNESN